MFNSSKTGAEVERIDKLKKRRDKGHKIMKKLRILMEKKKKKIYLIICRKYFFTKNVFRIEKKDLNNRF